jgi:hypothetical protein
MTTKPPEVRAAHLKSLAAAVRALGAPAAARVRTAAAATLERIAAAGRLDWLPATALVELCVAAEAEVGAAALERWGVAAFDATVRAPLARAFYEAALALERWNPAIVLSYLVQAWPLLYRGCGDLVLASTEPGCVRLVHVPVPPLLRRDATVLPLIGAIGSMPAHCRREGGATAEWDEESDRFVYVVRWR